MTTRHLVDPETLPLVEAMPPLRFSDETIRDVRAMLVAAKATRPAPAILPDTRLAPGRDGAPSVPVLLFDPPGRVERAAVLHVHGGGMVVGSADGSSVNNAELARELGVLVASVEYRLAPEHPFPAPEQDCLAAYDWLLANGEWLRVDPGRVVLMGESAGGGLAAALALMIRDLGRPTPRAQILTYPMLDHRTGTDMRPALPNTGEFIWTADLNGYGWRALRGAYRCDDERTGWFSPATAASLAGLPPAFIATGALDLLLDENLDYARRLVAAGVPVELHVYPGAVHAFDLVPDTRLTRRYTRDLRAAVARALAP